MAGIIFHELKDDLLIYLSVNGHMVISNALPIVNNAAMKICVQVFV